MKFVRMDQVDVFLFLTVFVVIISADETIENLEPMNVLRDHLTLSGFSSGGGFAQMLQFAYSSKIQGVGVFSHTFYRCGPPNGNFTDWDKQCTLLHNASASEWYDPEKVHLDIQEYYTKGLIDNPSNIQNKRLYVYTGLRSFIFHPVQSLNILKVYERYIRNPSKVKTRVQDSVFVMPTDNQFGMGCKFEANKNFFIGNCGFSGAFEALRFLLCDDFKIEHPRKHVNLIKMKTLRTRLRGVRRGWKPQPRWRNAVSALQLQPLRSFNQSKFLHGLTKPQMDDVGYLYVPTRCRDPTHPCLLHVFFHGCLTNRNVSGSKFVENSGFLEVAEANDIIILFPQNHDNGLAGTPADGCWDTFGYSGPLYATQKGDQLTAVWRMITHLISGTGPMIHPPFIP